MKKVILKALIASVCLSLFTFFAYRLFMSHSTSIGISKKYIAHFTLSLEKETKKKDAVENVVRKAKALGYGATGIFADSNHCVLEVSDVTDTSLVSDQLFTNVDFAFTDAYQFEDLKESFIKADNYYRQNRPKEELMKAAKKPLDSSKVSEYVGDGPAIRAPLQNSTEYRIFFNIVHCFGADSSGFTAPFIGLIAKRDTALLNKLLYSDEYRHFFPSDVQFLYQKSIDTSVFLYAARKDSLINIYGLQNIEHASLDYNKWGNANLKINLNAFATKRFAYLTEKNLNRAIFVVVNNQVIMSPVVNGPIPNGNIEINFAGKEGQLLYDQITTRSVTTGNIPSFIKVIYEEQPIIPTAIIFAVCLVLYFGIFFLVFYLLRK